MTIGLETSRGGGWEGGGGREEGREGGRGEKGRVGEAGQGADELKKTTPQIRQGAIYTGSPSYLQFLVSVVLRPFQHSSVELGAGRMGTESSLGKPLLGIQRGLSWENEGWWGVTPGD